MGVLLLEFLIQQDGAQDSESLRRAQAMRMLLVWAPHFENRCFRTSVFERIVCVCGPHPSLAILS